MKVPAAIRAVSRPKNTVVENNGRPGPNQYAVRERAGITYVPGGNPKPRNGKVIGEPSGRLKESGILNTIKFDLGIIESCQMSLMDMNFCFQSIGKGDTAAAFLYLFLDICAVLY